MKSLICLAICLSVSFSVAGAGDPQGVLRTDVSVKEFCAKLKGGLSEKSFVSRDQYLEATKILEKWAKNGIQTGDFLAFAISDERKSAFGGYILTTMHERDAREHALLFSKKGGGEVVSVAKIGEKVPAGTVYVGRKEPQLVIRLLKVLVRAENSEEKDRTNQVFPDTLSRIPTITASEQWTTDLSIVSLAGSDSRATVYLVDDNEQGLLSQYREIDSRIKEVMTKMASRSLESRLSSLENAAHLFRKRGSTQRSEADLQMAKRIKTMIPELRDNPETLLAEVRLIGAIGFADEALSTKRHPQLDPAIVLLWAGLPEQVKGIALRTGTQEVIEQVSLPDDSISDSSWRVRSDFVLVGDREVDILETANIAQPAGWLEDDIEIQLILIDDRRSNKIPLKYVTERAVE
ncbi:hypothetical protein [Stratiformator vulcanicus]|nr:hypothetical protein [Stratiformator vulcanicus]